MKNTTFISTLVASSSASSYTNKLKKTSKHGLIIAICTISASTGLNAAIIAFDDFTTYTAGNINGQDGGGSLLGFASTTWVADNGNSGSSDEIVGNTLTVVGDSFRARRSFGTSPLATSGTIYFKTNLTLGLNGFVALELATTINSDANSVRIIKSGTSFQVDTFGTGGADSATFGTNDGTSSNLFILGLNLDTQAGQVWLNPDLETFDGTSGATSTFTIGNDFELNGIQTASFSGSSNLIIVDDITFGTTAASVAIPEPSSTVLIGLGGLALIMRRRR